MKRIVMSDDDWELLRTLVKSMQDYHENFYDYRAVRLADIQRQLAAAVDEETPDARP